MDLPGGLTWQGTSGVLSPTLTLIVEREAEIGTIEGQDISYAHLFSFLILCGHS